MILFRFSSTERIPTKLRSLCEESSMDCYSFLWLVVMFSILMLIPLLNSRRLYAAASTASFDLFLLSGDPDFADCLLDDSLFFRVLGFAA